MERAELDKYKGHGIQAVSFKKEYVKNCFLLLKKCENV